MIDKVSYIVHIPGHKNSSGESAPWVIKQESTGKILSSHPTKESASAHLKQIEYFKHKGSQSDTLNIESFTILDDPNFQESDPRFKAIGDEGTNNSPDELAKRQHDKERKEESKELSFKDPTKKSPKRLPNMLELDRPYNSEEPYMDKSLAGQNTCKHDGTRNSLEDDLVPFYYSAGALEIEIKAEDKVKEDLNRNKKEEADILKNKVVDYFVDISMDIHEGDDNYEETHKEVSEVYDSVVATVPVDNVEIWRALAVQDTAQFLKKVKEDAEPMVGNYWAWKIEGARSYGSGGSGNVILHGRVASSEIDLEATYLANLMDYYEYNEGMEYEITVKDWGVVTLIDITIDGKVVPITKEIHATLEIGIEKQSSFMTYDQIKQFEKEGETDKEKYFEERTNKHIKLVQESAKEIVEAYPELGALLEAVKDHDASKFKEPERAPYIELTWDRRKDKIDTWRGSGNHSKKDINNATLFHVTHNPHHPEYWNKEEANISKEDRDKSDKCMDATKMSDVAIAEMISDWNAMGIELGNTARDWYNKQKDVRWHFSKQQNELIDKLLKVFEKHSNNEKEMKESCLNIEAKFDKQTIQTEDVPKELISWIKDIQKNISEESLSTSSDEKGWISKGLQEKFHITILYGVEDKDKEAISNICKKYLEKGIKVKFDKVDYFENKEDKFTCAVVLLESVQGLKELHDELKKSVPNKDEFPTYKPHIAIAYLKEGEKI